MKNLSTIFLITICVPSVAFSAFSDEMNSLLQWVFPSESAQNVETDFSTESENIAPVSPTNFRGSTDIQTEEERLVDIENQIRSLQQELADTASERTLIEGQLELLDREAALTQEKAQQLATLRQKWQEELETITRQKSALRAHIRTLESERDKNLSKKIIQEDSFQGSRVGSLIRWIFSDRSMAEVQEDAQRERVLRSQQDIQFRQLQELKTSLDQQEQQAAQIFARVSTLTNQIVAQKKTLSDLAEAKARVRNRLEYDEGRLERALDLARRQQAAATIYLQNLYADKEPPSETPAPEVAPEVFALEFPLPLLPKITASFGDPDYKKRLHRDHWGVDFWAPQGTEILAPAGGTVQKVAQNGYNYSYVILDHGNDFYTVYGHVSDILLREGDTVSAGQAFALTGGTPGTPGAGAFTTGPHLHFEVFIDGEHRDPMEFLKVGEVQ
ncbi:MAG: peptidoglycan DD-metalloendopeptidase family protein [Candidatus Gracilibacteria bacterium]|nr:peptidoglycan DD-metalloendopeptidase family protein [Candidatus Gracilibacteria bacterium]